MRFTLLALLLLLTGCGTSLDPSGSPNRIYPALSYDKPLYTQADMRPSSATLTAACPGQKLIYPQVVRVHVDGIVHIELSAKLIGGLSGNDPLDRDHKVTMVDVYHNLIGGTVNRPLRNLTIPELPPGRYWIVGMAQGIAHPYTQASTYRIELTVPQGCPAV